MASYKQHFLQLLKDNNAYEQFMFNFNSKKGRIFRANRGLNCSTKSYFNACYKKNYLSDAFLWGVTSQKHDYWYSLNKEWLDLLEKK